MHLAAPLTLALPALAAAQAQKPLTDQAKAWFDRAKSLISTAAPSISVPAAVKSPLAASAAKIAALKIHPLSMGNYEDILAPEASRAAPTEWMVLVSGGNKTCGGQCSGIEVAFNETASLLAADPTAPKLGYLNCDDQAILCTTWAARPPTIWHIQRNNPGPDQSMPKLNTIHVNYLNFTTTTAQDMVALHTGKKYEDGLVLEGMFHPFDGWMAQYGVNKPVGYVLFAFGLVPSWAMMLLVSMGSRYLIAKRNGPNLERARQANAQAAGGASGGGAPQGGAPAANQ